MTISKASPRYLVPNDQIGQLGTPQFNGGTFFMGEQWKFIDGTENLYLVSTGGLIKRVGGRLKKTFLKETGYECVGMSVKARHIVTTVHRLVAKAFIPNPLNKQEVNHKNGIKTDNRVENLEWCTRSENKKHAYSFGIKSNAGEKHSRRKLSWLLVGIIREAYAVGHKSKDIAEYFNMSHNAIYKIVKHKTWLLTETKPE